MVETMIDGGERHVERGEMDLWYRDCPVCGWELPVTGLYGHGVRRHGFVAKDWERYDMGRLVCPACGRSVSVSNIGNHVGTHGGLHECEVCGRPVPGMLLDEHMRSVHPTPCIVSYLGERCCSMCLRPLRREYGRVPFCELRCPQCGAWWPLTRMRLGAGAMDVEDDVWLFGDRLDAYARYCLRLEDATALARALHRLGGNHDWPKQVERIERAVADDDMGTLDRASDELERLQGIMSDELAGLMLTPEKRTTAARRRMAAGETARMRLR